MYLNVNVNLREDILFMTREKKCCNMFFIVCPIFADSVLKKERRTHLLRGPNREMSLSSSIQFSYSMNYFPLQMHSSSHLHFSKILFPPFYLLITAFPGTRTPFNDGWQDIESDSEVDRMISRVSCLLRCSALLHETGITVRVVTYSWARTRPGGQNWIGEALLDEVLVVELRGKVGNMIWGERAINNGVECRWTVVLSEMLIPRS